MSERFPSELMGSSSSVEDLGEDRGNSKSVEDRGENRGNTESIADRGEDRGEERGNAESIVIDSKDSVKFGCRKGNVISVSRPSGDVSDASWPTKRKCNESMLEMLLAL